MVVEDAQDDIALGSVDRRDEGLRTAKHDFTLRGTHVSMPPMHVQIGMRLQMDVKFHGTEQHSGPEKASHFRTALKRVGRHLCAAAHRSLSGGHDKQEPPGAGSLFPTVDLAC
jgi:hypothetical protein